jgi:hypothetical protein
MWVNNSKKCQNVVVVFILWMSSEWMRDTKFNCMYFGVFMNGMNACTIIFCSNTLYKCVWQKLHNFFFNFHYIFWKENSFFNKKNWDLQVLPTAIELQTKPQCCLFWHTKYTQICVLWNECKSLAQVCSAWMCVFVH